MKVYHIVWGAKGKELSDSVVDLLTRGEACMLVATLEDRDGFAWNAQGEHKIYDQETGRLYDLKKDDRRVRVNTPAEWTFPYIETAERRKYLYEGTVDELLQAFQDAGYALDNAESSQL